MWVVFVLVFIASALGLGIALWEEWELNHDH